MNERWQWRRDSLVAQRAAWSARGQRWLADRRAAHPLVDTASALVQRDQDAFAGVLGSAIALRLFLFFVPSIAVFVGIVTLIGVPSVISSALSASGTTGKVANDIQSASSLSGRGGLAITVSGVVVMLWAGRGLTRVLAASSAGGWGLAARDAKPTLKMAGTLSGLLFTMVVLTGLMSRLRRESGVVLTGGTLAVSVTTIALAWWLVMWTLPSGSRDPGAQIPGGLFLGGTTTLLQWVTQYYLPAKLARSSETMGSIGFTIAALGYFFLVGRLMATSFVVNAVVFERYGSVSSWFFGLAGIRRLPRRFPRLATFFQLDRDAT